MGERESWEIDMADYMNVLFESLCFVARIIVHCYRDVGDVIVLVKLRLFRALAPAGRLLHRCTTVSSMLVVSALADATMVVIELRELSRRIYACTMYFIHFNISHGALIAVINM